jgi:hypothetical protein
MIGSSEPKASEAKTCSGSFGRLFGDLLPVFWTVLSWKIPV